ncbi:MAG: PEP-CTERM sorting domain-containing protein [Planctomycetes bacterium]|nr:PEP-CTERM sorting domain-containing protein [Planctomycetota bacterium]
MATTLAVRKLNHPGITAAIILALGTGLLLTMSPAARAQAFETQSFDSEASASAAGWTEFQSRDAPFDYGFSNTNNAEGDSGSGEAGGTIARGAGLNAYYADLTLGGSSDLSLDLHATGRLKIRDVDFDGEMYLGWFDSAVAEAAGFDVQEDKDYIGLRFFEPNNGLWRLYASIDGIFPSPIGVGNQIDLPDDTALDFEIDWDADGGAIAGDGLLTLTFSTLDGTQTFVSTVEGSSPMTWDAFGLLSNNQDRLQQGLLWVDDLSYTTLALALASDLNNNGFVDFEDLTILLANWNKDVGADDGNLVEPLVSVVNFADLTVLLADWTGPGPAGSPEAALGEEAVPEPSSLLLGVMATLGLSFYRRRRRRGGDQ